MRINGISAFVVSFALAWPCAANAELVSFKLTGMVMYRTDVTASLGDNFAPGQAFTATVSFDTADALVTGFQSDEFLDHSLNYFGAASHVVAESNGLVIHAPGTRTNPCNQVLCVNPNFLASASSNGAGGDSLRYFQMNALRIGEAGASVPGATQDGQGIFIHFSDHERLAFQNGFDLTKVPDIAKFPYAEFSLQAYGGPGIYGTPEVLASVSGKILTAEMVSSVPEPATATTLLLGLLGIAGFARRSKQRRIAAS